MFDESVDPIALICLANADRNGSISIDKHESNDKFLYKRLNIYYEYMSRPFVTGLDLIENGLIPNSNFSLILNYAHKLRLSGVKKETALKQTLAYARNLK